MAHKLKLRLFIFFTLLSCSDIISQETKNNSENVKTKMDVFNSKTGIITKYIDTKLSSLKTSYGNAESKIRKVVSGSISAYFYQISKQGKYGESTASIEYTDLIEVIKALKILQPEMEKDIALNPDYLENKFVTADGFEVGYYVSSGKANWYIKLEKHGSDNTLFLNNGNLIEISFTEARSKIDELKK
ncbi:hypothetical protein [Flavobacterium johnsoniae]|uniref:Hypothetical lipoprotein n=1 Tax=Flavobacterium johnsoniae (strain ATCC 17061 / DSM 2064 / JCM 8514 / BCRC 14874 / CCUG 350202 / NBRC 14942 / NCIMB 11054 / UW101) TaxID=376686 RepID=A5FDL1_FLAJ1|nr:hypothetical protein [Flavobacterium johnsoniae]ABQ06706.1 hypothetical lipoprotein [Flavobacterium johnsoniae UW101]OXE95266.1 hypothetical protein B0A63_25170 [Flavobacterium johnsoniae UW101]WQG82464.1 hypothetical protein SR927_04955 [Flavobacterium johnsoniae UW101]SHM02110.1 hypothetical protein SAMN05444146_5203 [Flavobacterium johnsoniae]